MITIEIIGIDPYLVGQYSKDHTANLASLFECDEEEVMFIGSNDAVYHKGNDQTSWNAIVRIYLSERFEPVEKLVSKYILKTLNEFSIHVHVIFVYLHSHAEYSYVNKAYPRYLDDSTKVDPEDEINEEIEIFEGNIFDGYEEELDRIYDEKEGKIGD